MKKTLPIQWMHCKSCELLIEQQCEQCNCSLDTISFKSKQITISYKSEDDLTQFTQAVNKLWYHVGESSSHDTSWLSRWQKLLIIAWVMLLFVLFGRSDFVYKLMPNYDALTWSIALLVWLIASVSTCLAVTWWIVIGYTETVEDNNPWTTQLKFHLWRIVAFVIWGFLLWLLWNQFTQSLWFTIIINVLVGGMLIVLWLQILWILWPGWFAIRRPRRISSNILKLKNPAYAPRVWAATFFLPCGFTQAMQLFALQSWSPMQWALIMGMFALWTLPVLLTVWMTTSHIKKHIKTFNPIIASLLFLFWLYTVFNAYGLFSAQTSQQIINNTAVTSSNDAWAIDYTIIEVWHGGRSFEPDPIVLPVGKYYEIRVTPSSNGLWCMSQLARWWRAINIRQWQTFSLHIDWTRPWKIPLVCASMGMRQGEIVIQ